jgi:hypothetical protein
MCPLPAIEFEESNNLVKLASMSLSSCRILFQDFCCDPVVFHCFSYMREIFLLEIALAFYKIS